MENWRHQRIRLGKKQKRATETAYLFRSPANARRLLDAAESARRGDLIEPALGLE